MNYNETIKSKKSLGMLRKANKTKPRSPDLMGQMRLQRHTTAALVKEFEDSAVDEIVCNIAAWRNQDHVGSYLTVELSPRFPARQRIEEGDVIDAILNEREDQ
jgi:hypothetical protein